MSRDEVWCLIALVAIGAVWLVFKVFFDASPSVISVAWPVLTVVVAFLLLRRQRKRGDRDS